MGDDGLLSGPLDIDAPRARGVSAAPLAAALGTVLVHRASGIEGSVVRYAEGQMVVLRDRQGRDHSFRPVAGGFLHQGRPVSLVAARARVAGPAAVRYTASGSVDLGAVAARVARPSRIYVEGTHDAELIEKVWGDDLRVEGVVVQPMHGVDDLPMLVRTFNPGPRRRLGVLVDHLVHRSKEQRLAEASADPHVLVAGHPYIDMWQAVRPQVVGLERWPTVPVGTPWKDGILAAVGFGGEPAQFWRQVVRRVTTWKDLETPLITAVEQLIDFVTAGEADR